MTQEQANTALDRLEEIRLKIESLKAQRGASAVDSLSAQLAQKFQMNAP